MATLTMCVPIAAGMGLLMGLAAACGTPVRAADAALPGTELLSAPPGTDWAAVMVEGIDQFLAAETQAALERRPARWTRDLSSWDALTQSVEPQRRRLREILGVVDPRVEFEGPELVATTARGSLVGRGPGYEVHRIRWPVIAGVMAEGLLARPTDRPPVADVVCLPTADQTPEQLLGLRSATAVDEPGAAAMRREAAWALRLVESGCRVVVPVVIDRQTSLSRGVRGTAPSTIPHREFLYRQAFELGRHLVGYEAQTALAVVDWFDREARAEGREPRIAVAGDGEGGLIALVAAALDTRVDAALVSGYFTSRQDLYAEPIDRNVFGWLVDFGDAELAGLIAPRGLVVEASRFPDVPGRPLQRERHSLPTPGRLATPPRAAVEAEFERALAWARLSVGARPAWSLVGDDDGAGPAGSGPAIVALLRSVADAAPLAPPGELPAAVGEPVDAAARHARVFTAWQDFTQRLLARSETIREAYWAAADRKSRTPEAWQASVAEYRRRFYDDVIGRFDRPLLPPGPRTRRIHDAPRFTTYEVVLDVFPGVIAYGHLLVPKDLRPGERRPVVVCQHGLEGRPSDLTDPAVDHPAYHRYAVQLAERGFVTYAPQNPYIFQDAFRQLQRRANPLGKTLFSVIVPQHQQTVDWLASLEFVDPERIAFYGLSYGGKTAMRVPPLVERYCLSICSGDFNEWVSKNVSADWAPSYLHRNEYEIFEFNLGQTFNYAEMAGLICPRPFMVERGHRDGVALDEHVAYEYAKVQRLYADLKIPQRCEIEYFDGPHTIHGVGTFRFLHRHLNWPEPAAASPASP